MVMPSFSYSHKEKVLTIRQELQLKNAYNKEKAVMKQESLIYDEYEANFAYTKQLSQDEILYGSKVQLLHINSNKFLAVPKHYKAGEENCKLELVELHGKNTLFTFKNVFRYQKEGTRAVKYNTPIKLCYSMSFDEIYPSLYFNKKESKMKGGDKEPVLSMEDVSVLEAVRYCNGFNVDDDFIRGGDIVWVR